MQTDLKNAAAPVLDDQRRDIALFRYGLIADLVQHEPGHRGLYALLTKKAPMPLAHP